MARGFYGDALALAHAEAYAGFVQQAAPQVVATLKRRAVTSGHVLDLGCGAGQLSAALVRAGYEATGIDVSASFVALARKRVERGRFIVGSILNVPFPPCDAVAAVGEVLNYLPNVAAVKKVLRKAYRCLRPGGLLVFDLLLPSARPLVRTHVERAPTWTLLAAISEQPLRRRVIRDITVFRKDGTLYRRTHEVHRQRTYPATEICDVLRDIGYRVQLRRGYGDVVSAGHRVFVAKKIA